jgi:hypothetical protein
MNKTKKIIIFFAVNIIGFFTLMYVSFRFHNYAKAKNKKKGEDAKPDTLMQYLNKGDVPSYQSLLVGLTFGVVFGFLDNIGLWMGIDTFYDYIPGGTLTKGAWGNTYSDLLGATVGTFIANMAQDYYKYDPSDEPIWLNTLGIFLGCIIGMTVGRTLTERD